MGMTDHQRSVLASMKYACEYQGDDESIAVEVRSQTTPEERKGFVAFVEQEVKLNRGSWAYDIADKYRYRRYVEIVKKYGGLNNVAASAYQAKMARPKPKCDTCKSDLEKYVKGNGTAWRCGTCSEEDKEHAKEMDESNGWMDR